jgi:hypothetical protein
MPSRLAAGGLDDKRRTALAEDIVVALGPECSSRRVAVGGSLVVT